MNDLPESIIIVHSVCTGYFAWRERPRTSYRTRTSVCLAFVYQQTSIAENVRRLLQRRQHLNFFGEFLLCSNDIVLVAGKCPLNVFVVCSNFNGFIIWTSYNSNTHQNIRSLCSECSWSQWTSSRLPWKPKFESPRCFKNSLNLIN